MTFRGYRIHIILIAFAVCLAVALGVQRLAHSQRVVAPLERAFMDIPGVTAVALVASGSSTDVVLEVDPAADIGSAYRAAQAAAAKHLGAGLGRVVLADERTPALADAFYRVHLILQEGAATGRFTEMASRLADLAANLPVTDCRVYVDDQWVYVVLAADDGYLYEMIARPGTRAREVGA